MRTSARWVSPRGAARSVPDRDVRPAGRRLPSRPRRRPEVHEPCRRRAGNPLAPGRRPGLPRAIRAEAAERAELGAFERATYCFHSRMEPQRQVGHDDRTGFGSAKVRPGNRLRNRGRAGCRQMIARPSAAARRRYSPRRSIGPPTMAISIPGRARASSRSRAIGTPASDGVAETGENRHEPVFAALAQPDRPGKLVGPIAQDQYVHEREIVSSASGETRSACSR